ncbi:MAG: cytochrome c1 [Pseudomonadales bacterium]|nr:cytochrome c1 [Pseudomonadales bacterium]
MLFTGTAFLSTASASSGGYHLEHIEPDLSDKPSLQRGAQTYMNYCMGCHSLKYQRYVRTATDLDIPEELMLKHLAFDPDTKIGDLMENAISEDNAKFWFGAVPPDLTLQSNLKAGPDWVYTYLKTFYEDSARPFGVNNLVFENVGMPHVLAGLQGRQIRPACRQLPQKADNGGQKRDPETDELLLEEICGHDEISASGHSPLQKVAQTGSLSAEEYDQVIYDLSNFLYYVGEPARIDRTRIGGYVLLFLAFFYVFARLLGREYDKEFHKS